MTPPDVNGSPGFLTPSLKLCSGITLCMLFTTLLTCWTQSRIMCTLLFPCKIDLFYWWLNAIVIPAMDHRTVNWNLFARLSITIHQHPSTYNIRMFWLQMHLVSSSFPFSPWRMTRHSCPRARGNQLRRKCSGSYSRRLVIHASDTGPHVRVRWTASSTLAQTLEKYKRSCMDTIICRKVLCLSVRRCFKSPNSSTHTITNE